MDSIFGGTKQVSTLTPAQRSLLAQIGGLQNQYNPSTYAGLNAIASDPASSYQYNEDDGAAAFQSGIYNPAMREMNRQIGDTMHSSNLHSSANRVAQDRIRQGTMDNINGLSYQNMMNQQKLRQDAQEQAYGRQLSSLNSLLGGNQSVLGTQGTALQKTGGLLDIMSAAGALGQGIGAVMGGGKR